MGKELARAIHQLYQTDNIIADIMELALDPETGEVIDSDFFKKVSALDYRRQEIIMDMIEYKTQAELIIEAMKEREALQRALRKEVEHRVEIAKVSVKNALGETRPKFSTIAGNMHWTSHTKTIVDEEKALADIERLQMLEFERGIKAIKVEYTVLSTGLNELQKAGIDIPYIKHETKYSPVFRKPSKKNKEITNGG